MLSRGELTSDDLKNLSMTALAARILTKGGAGDLEKLRASLDDASSSSSDKS